MKCARCSADLPASSKFCLQCGSPVVSAAASTPLAPAPPFGAASAPLPAALKTNRLGNSGRIAIVLLILAILSGAAMVLHGSLTHAPASSSSGGALVNAPADSGTSSLVQAPAESHNAPLVQSPGSAQAPPDLGQRPDVAENISDILDYLRFLKGIEADRKALQHSEDSHLKTMATMMTARQGSEALRGTDDPSAAGDPKVKNLLPDHGNYVAQIHVDWQALSKRFVAKQPPAACIELRNRYLDQLGKTESELAAVFGLFETMSADPSSALQKAYDMQGKSGDIDASMGAADDELADVCHKHGIRKDFDIKDPDSSAGLGGLLKGFSGM